MLINVIFFKSEWKNSFNVDYSYIDKFHKKSGSDVEVEFTKQNGFVGVFDDEKNRFQALCLDFKFNDLVGLFVQFSKDKTVHGLISILQFADLKNCVDLIHCINLKVSIPKFKIQSMSSVNEILYHMGVTEIFDDLRCNLQNISNQPLKVDDIVHSSTVEIDEKGVVASAATAVRVNCKAFVKRSGFILDSPLLFIILDRQTNLPLFMNAIHDPTQL
ncbi:Serine proteinase inhibitor A3K [Thelohanellus kitauei]|uniref:Serine proteinase inhibitor A3K n=1 Tax=Thelohanellus kitauei TaxID=669202 RepID=A0A0C2IA28_THEKT|nr:Serine proteinase inhibitor A3K [Thelohanellus kitauei]